MPASAGRGRSTVALHRRLCRSSIMRLADTLPGRNPALRIVDLQRCWSQALTPSTPLTDRLHSMRGIYRYPGLFFLRQGNRI